MSSASVKELEAKIVSDTKNLNLITKVVNGIKAATTPGELKTWYQSLSRIFGHLATKGLIATDPSDSAEDYIRSALSGSDGAEPPTKKQKCAAAPKSALDQAREWCRNKWADSIHSLLAIATNTGSKGATYDLEIRTTALNGFMEFVPLASEKEAYLFVSFFMTQVMCKQNKDKDLKPLLIDFSKKYLSVYADLYSVWLKALMKAFKVDTKSNLRATLKILSLAPIPDKSIETPALLWAQAKKAKKTASLPDQYGACWVDILKEELSEKLLRKILPLLPDAVLPFIPQPLTLLDFLKAAYARGGVLAVLSLKSIFYMMSRFNLDFPEFYTKLYALVTPEVLSSKYRNEFFLTAERFLHTGYISMHVVSSFLKRLARVSLTLPPAALLLAIPFAYNLMYEHIQTRNLLLRCYAPLDKLKKDAKEAECEDPFDEAEEDPTKTDAIESYLWEFMVLTEHYDPMVSKLAQVFKNQTFEKLPYDLREFSEMSYQSVLDTELGRKQKSVPLEYRNKTSLFGDDEAFTLSWKIDAPAPSNDFSGDR